MAAFRKRYFIEVEGEKIEVFPSEGLHIKKDNSAKVVVNNQGVLVFLTVMGELKIIGSNEHSGFVTSYT